MIMLNSVSDPLLFYADSDPEDGMNADPHPGVKISADPKPWLKMLGPERGWAGCRWSSGSASPASSSCSTSSSSSSSITNTVPDQRNTDPGKNKIVLQMKCRNFFMSEAREQGCGSGSYLDLKAWNPPKNVYFSLTKKNLFNETETNVERTLNKTNTNLPALICMTFFNFWWRFSVKTKGQIRIRSGPSVGDPN